MARKELLDNLYVYFSILFFFSVGVYFLLFSRKAKEGIEKAALSGGDSGSLKFRRWRRILSVFLSEDHPFLRAEISFFWVRLWGVISIIVSLVIIYFHKHHY